MTSQAMVKLAEALERYSECRDDRPLVYAMVGGDQLTVGDLRKVYERARLAAAPAASGEVREALDTIRRFQRHVLLREYDANGMVRAENFEVSNALDTLIAALPAAGEGGTREQVALAIERADRERPPEGYANGFDHDEISDWNLYLADAVLRALAPARPEGWQLVPKEPTKEMIQACIWALDRWREKNGNVQGFVPPGDKYQVRWRAMLEAAPSAPQRTGE